MEISAKRNKLCGKDVGRPTWRNWREEEQTVRQMSGQAHMEKLARRGTNRVAKAWAGPHREIGAKPSPSAGPHECQLHKA